MASRMMAMEAVLKVSGSFFGRGLWPTMIVPCRGFKKPYRNKIPSRRKLPGPGMYAGQISNFDTNDLDFFPAEIPNIPYENPEKFQPSKLLVVWKRGSYRGQPYWLQDIMEKSLKFDKRSSEPAIVKNTPFMLRMLWHVKHLVTIKPLTFPNGIPTEEDLGATYITQTGELVIHKKLKVDLERLETDERNPKELDYPTILKHERLKWNTPYE